MSNAMELTSEALEKIGDYVRKNLGSWMLELDPRGASNLDLLERMVRVEEELKSQRDLMKQGFDLMERRFEQVDKRFEQVDKRFEDMNHRFEDMHRHMARWFTVLTVIVGIIGLAGIVLPLLP